MNMDVIHIDKESSKRPAANSYRQVQSSYELGKIGEKDKDVITCFKENASPLPSPPRICMSVRGYDPFTALAEYKGISQSAEGGESHHISVVWAAAPKRRHLIFFCSM